MIDDGPDLSAPPRPDDVTNAPGVGAAGPFGPSLSARTPTNDLDQRVGEGGSPTGVAANPADGGRNARRQGGGRAEARVPDSTHASSAGIDVGGLAVQVGTREALPLSEPCIGATTGRLGEAGSPLEDLDSDPKTFSVELTGSTVGSRMLTLDCANRTASLLELLVYRQTWSPGTGLGTVALLAALALGSTAAAFLLPTTVGAATSRRSRDEWPPPWFPPDSTEQGSHPPPFTLRSDRS